MSKLKYKMDLIVKKTNVWGHFYKSKGSNYFRLLKKSNILNNYPIIDHVEKYCLKHSGQKGPPKESQTFIVSYAYNYDHFIENKENEFIEHLTTINLSFHKQPCIYNDKPAYKIYVMDTDVSIQQIIDLI